MSGWSAASIAAAIPLWCRAITATASGKRRFRAAGFTPTLCRRVDRRYAVAGGAAAAGDYPGLDPAIGADRAGGGYPAFLARRFRVRAPRARICEIASFVFGTLFPHLPQAGAAG